MKASFQQPRSPLGSCKAIAGFSMIEVILAIGLLAFGVGIALRLLTGSLETLKAARSANTALDMAPIVEAKLSQPGIDGPPSLNVKSQISLKRRFFNDLFLAIKDNNAAQLLLYSYKSDPDDGNDLNALGARFVPLVGASNLGSHCSSTLDKMVEDAPGQLFRLVLSASPANEEDLIYTKKATNQLAFQPDRIPSFVKYDVKSGALPNGSSSQTLDICQIKPIEKADAHSSLVVRAHIFRQGFPFSPGAKATIEELNRNLQFNNLAFTFDVMVLAY